MFTYIVKRLLTTVPVVGVIALGVFSMLYLTPGDPVASLAGDQATPEDLQRIRSLLGLDKSFLPRFGDWLAMIVQGDLGRSLFTNHSVAQLIGQRVEPTLSLMCVTFALTVVLAIPAGVLSAWKARSWIDDTVTAVSVLGFSVPGFVIAYAIAYVFAVKLQWLPSQGYVSFGDDPVEWFKGLVLPSLALSGTFVALVARMTRASMIDVLKQDYVRTAKAKGLSQPTILFVHALKNASIPIVTVLGLGLASLLGGAVVIESVFAIPGIGRLTLDSILRRDYPVIQGVVLLCSLTYVLVNLLVDVSYTLLDPRIRY